MKTLAGFKTAITDINQIINFRGYIQECDNILNPSKKPVNSDNLNMAQLVLIGRSLHIAEIFSSEYYCHDCSHDYGRPVYHKTDNRFSEFKNNKIIRDNAEKLNNIASYL